MKTNGTDLIKQERERQINVEGFSPSHDDQHVQEELACAAAFYAMPEKYGEMLVFWQFTELPKKSAKDRIRQLVIAGAFISAEIDRLQRLDE